MANYQNTKPAAADQLNQSQADIQQNFLAIDDLINVDHEDFNGGATPEGKHKQVTFPEQGTDITAAPQTLVNETAIYCRQNAANVSALFFRPENQAAGAGTEYEFTSYTHAAGPPARGYTRLPSGILLKWGSGTVNTNSSATATYDATEAITTIFTGSATLNGGSGMDKALFITTLGTASMVVYNANANGGTRTFYYFVMGI
jgi:hypothetical protein